MLALVGVLPPSRPTRAEEAMKRFKDGPDIFFDPELAVLEQGTIGETLGVQSMESLSVFVLTQSIKSGSAISVGQ